MDSHQRYPGTPVEIARSFWQNRRLIWQLSRRDVVGRYRGSLMGLAWSFFNPLLMLSVYTFVFLAVFKSRWDVSGGGAEDEANFAVILFAGMIVHGLFAECANRAPGLILANVNYVKKVVFPLEILPWVALASALFHALISLGVLLAAQAVISRQLPWTVVFIPFVMLPLLLGTIGFAWFLSAIGVFVRDIGHTMSIFTAVLLFLSPVFYPVSALPAGFQRWFVLNPLAFIIEAARASLIFGRVPDWVAWTGYFTGSLAFAWAGFWWFQRTRKGFADAL